MKNFKFVCRDEEIKDIISNLKNHSIVCLHSQDNSGLTHFLRHTMQLLWDDVSVSFYIDCESQISISEQIIGQTMMFSKNDSPIQNNTGKLLKKYIKKDIVHSIVSSCLITLDAIPFFPNIGTLASTLITSIRDTLDVDHEHLADYKTEKAVKLFFEKLIKSKKSIYFLIDNTHQFNINQFEFLSSLINQYKVHVLFSSVLNPQIDMAEHWSKFSEKLIDTQLIQTLSFEFERPNQTIIEALYQCYGAKFLPEKMETFDRHSRNIHIIMADIRGIPTDPSDLDEQQHYLLKVLSILGGTIPKSILFKIYMQRNQSDFIFSDTPFQKLCDQASNLGLITISEYYEESIQMVSLNKKAFSHITDEISYIEKQNIATTIITAMDTEMDVLNSTMLEFAIKHLEHDYSHCKRYILAHARLQSRKNKITLTYIDKLNYFDDIRELVYVVGLYYDYGVYDKPYRLLQMHSVFSNNETYKIAQALICERLHIEDYVNKLEQLYNSSPDNEKRCLLGAVLFVAYLNSDNAQKYKCFFDEKDSHYYQIYHLNRNYPYLLRNISYYMDNVPKAIQHYKDCLEIFHLNDPVNYNRTISNLICYLMRNDSNPTALNHLKEITEEVARILDFNDPAYAFLNNNYGIYLMLYTDKDPSAYFSSIPFSTGTTETPYIYAQVNLALYYLKSNPSLALKTMNCIEEQVNKTSVPRTKQFYNINRALIDYANDISPEDTLREIVENPIRGITTYANTLNERYLKNAEGNISFNWAQMRELSLPGYLFYRYFKAEKLLSDL